MCQEALNTVERISGRKILISRLAEQFCLAGSLWTCVLEIRGPKLNSSSLQLVLIDIVRRFGMSRKKMGS
jgi:hypothetical protein